MILAASLVAAAAAQPRVRGEVELRSGSTWTEFGGTWSSLLTVVYRAHLEVEASLGPLELRVVADPSVRLREGGPDAATLDLPVPEAFLRLAAGPVDVDAGRLRTAVGTARLLQPYAHDARSEAGVAVGWWGARATAYLDLWRLRGLAFVRTDDGGIGGLLSVRRDLGVADVEAHVRWLDTLAIGLGASGTIGDLIVYGEGWLLEAPWRGRGAIGLSGFAGDALWTAEVGYAPAPVAGGAVLPLAAARVDVPLEDGWSLGVDGGIAYVSADASRTGAETLVGLGGVGLRLDEADGGVSLRVTATRTDLATVVGFEIGVIGYF